MRVVVITNCVAFGNHPIIGFKTNKIICNLFVFVSDYPSDPNSNSDMPGISGGSLLDTGL